MKKTTIIYRLLPTLAFIAFCLFVLLGLRKEYLEEVAGMTPFYLSPTFTTQTWGQGFMGGITWCSTALCACMTNPVLGASLLTLLLTLLSLLIRYVLRVKWQWLPLCFIPSLWLLGNFTSRGYELYTSKDSGIQGHLSGVRLTETHCGLYRFAARWQERGKGGIVQSISNNKVFYDTN